MFEHTQPAALDADGAIDGFAEFRIDDARAIARMMADLVDGAVPVHLSAPGGVNLTTVLWTVDTAQRRIVFAADTLQPQLQPLAESDEATCVAYLDAVKLQFDLRDLMLVRGTQQCTLAAAMPTELYRFQRRGSFRVRTAGRGSPTAHLRHPSMPDMALALRVLDVSIGGCALLLPHDVPPIQPGSRIADVRIELDADTRLRATVLPHHVTLIHPGTQGARLGCELLDLDGAAERALQRYIDQTQKRQRLLSLTL
jgi:c-di-GMP-binding flagellar brake protein YcgR